MTDHFFGILFNLPAHRRLPHVMSRAGLVWLAISAAGGLEYLKR